MNTLPLISIITSTLNDAKALQQTINSVAHTTHYPVEYIVIDGGSTDSTIDVIKASSSVITNYISEKDSGIFDAWNKGLLLASGDYISFLGAGDIYVDGGLELLVACAVAHPKADFISSKIIVTEDDRVIRTLGSAWRWRTFRHYMNTAHTGALHSRRLFNEYGKFDTCYKIAGDYDFLLRANNKLNAAYVDVVTVKMIAGGVSYVGHQVFYETESAKIKNHATSSFVARSDRYIAQTKRFIRQWLTV